MRARTIAQVAAAIGCDDHCALKVLRSLERDGLAVETLLGWRLSPFAEREYGDALRESTAGLQAVA